MSDISVQSLRNANGSLKQKVLRAVDWYAVDHGLKLMALAAFPNFYFKTQQGEEVTANIADIVSDYDAHMKEVRKENARKSRQLRGGRH